MMVKSKGKEKENEVEVSIIGENRNDTQIPNTRESSISSQ